MLDDVVKQSIFKELQEEKNEKVQVCVHISVFIMFSCGNINGSFHSLIDPNVTEVVRDSKKVSTCGWPTFHSNSFIINVEFLFISCCSLVGQTAGSGDYVGSVSDLRSGADL